MDKRIFLGIIGAAVVLSLLAAFALNGNKFSIALGCPTLNSNIYGGSYASAWSGLGAPPVGLSIVGCSAIYPSNGTLTPYIENYTVFYYTSFVQPNGAPQQTNEQATISVAIAYSGVPVANAWNKAILASMQSSYAAAESEVLAYQSSGGFAGGWQAQAQGYASLSSLLNSTIRYNAAIPKPPPTNTPPAGNSTSTASSTSTIPPTTTMSTGLPTPTTVAACAAPCGHAQPTWGVFNWLYQLLHALGIVS